MMTLISMIDEFPSEREFRKRFPSRIYICFACGQMTPDPYVCIHCGSQANQLFPQVLFATSGPGEIRTPDSIYPFPPIYRYKISGIHNEVQQIFSPIEFNNKKG